MSFIVYCHYDVYHYQICAKIMKRISVAVIWVQLADCIWDSTIC